MRKSRGVLVTGGSSLLGQNIAAALLAEGSQVSLLAPAGRENRLGPLAQQVRWSHADVWSPGSLRGQARNHAAVIHAVGSMVADPSRGLSYDRLNFVSARNVANMCVSDGVQRMILVSAANAPWMNRAYIRSKRRAEAYIQRLGLDAQIIRAPLLYVPGESRPLFYRAASLLGGLPPLAWLFAGRMAPMPMDRFARALARIALDETQTAGLYYARDLRRMAGPASAAGAADPAMPIDDSGSPADALAEEAPFGWTPLDEQA